jgi:hypothetical protein
VRRRRNAIGHGAAVHVHLQRLSIGSDSKVKKKKKKRQTSTEFLSSIKLHLVVDKTDVLQKGVDSQNCADIAA